MTWVGWCAAAWRRFDAWLDKRDTVDADTATWLDSLSTPEDYAQGIADQVTRPGRRYQGRHARPKDFEETT